MKHRKPTSRRATVWVRPGLETLVKFGSWTPAKLENKMVDEKTNPNIRFELAFTCEIKHRGIEQLAEEDIPEYIKYLIEGSELGYDPVSWLRRRDELGLRYKVVYGAAYRPKGGKKWRELSCEGLELVANPRRRRRG